MAKKTKVRRVMTANDKATLMTALMYIVLGALFIIFRAQLIKWLMVAAGVVLIAAGVWEIVKKDLVTGVVLIAVGVLFLLGFIEAITGIVLLILGVVLVAKGVLDLVNAFKASKVSVLSVVAAVITISIGVLLIVAKWQLVDWVLIVVGAIMIVDGILIFFGKKLI